jgi:serine/threonine protein kinase
MIENPPVPLVPVSTVVGPYRVLKVIGSGTFATVSKAVHTLTHCEVALKAIPKHILQSMHDFELLQREVNLMKTMDHPYIASFFEVIEDPLMFYLAIEFVPHGTLLDRINSTHGLDELSARRIFSQLAQVLDYLHSQKRIVHRDLKAENILFDARGDIRLVDFGFSKSFSKSNPYMQTTCGSPAYVAPEVIRKEPYTALTDVWSAGVVLYATVCGGLPFFGDNLNTLLQAILEETPPLPSDLSPELQSLIRRVLEKDPRERITLPEIWEHPWMIGAENLDQDAIARMKVHEVATLDEVVTSEMRALGYDVTGLQQEIRGMAINARTAAYKMIRRKRVMEAELAREPERVNNDGRMEKSALPSLNGRRKSQPDCAQRVVMALPPIVRTPGGSGPPRIRRRSQVMPKGLPKP